MLRLARRPTHRRVHTAPKLHSLLAHVGAYSVFVVIGKAAHNAFGMHQQAANVAVNRR